MATLVDDYPPLNLDLVRWAVVHAGRLLGQYELAGVGDQWMQVPRDEREYLLFQVRPRGIWVEHHRKAWRTDEERKAVKQRDEVLAAGYLQAGSREWESAVRLLEFLPAERQWIDTRGD